MMHPVRECGLGGGQGQRADHARTGCTPCVNVGWEVDFGGKLIGWISMHPVRECGLGVVVVLLGVPGCAMHPVRECGLGGGAT